MRVEARPPHYASLGANALLMGGFWGAWMAVFAAAYAVHLHPGGGAEVVIKPICIALLSAVAFGLVMAAHFRARARHASLPGWGDLAAAER